MIILNTRLHQCKLYKHITATRDITLQALYGVDLQSPTRFPLKQNSNCGSAALATALTDEKKDECLREKDERLPHGRYSGTVHVKQIKMNGRYKSRKECKSQTIIA